MSPCHKKMSIAYISLGSNLGNRLNNIERAALLLSAKKNLKIKKKSSIYETEPIGGPLQNYFLNQVIEIETELSPRDLIEILSRIEKKLGRKKEVTPVRDKTPPHTISSRRELRGKAASDEGCLPDTIRLWPSYRASRQPISNGVKWGPRIIDLDILLFDDLVLKELDLEIPHPRLTERRFILVPLLEINSELYHPVWKRKIQEILDSLKDNKKVNPVRELRSSNGPG